MWARSTATRKARCRKGLQAQGHSPQQDVPPFKENRCFLKKLPGWS